jgi:hypothetical protein
MILDSCRGSPLISVIVELRVITCPIKYNGKTVNIKKIISGFLFTMTKFYWLLNFDKTEKQ